jgi:hypothetical protein
MCPYKARARATLSRHPKTYSRLKEKVDGGIPSEGGIEPSNPIERNRDPHDYSLAFLRAPLWLLADSYRMEHRLPLEFPVSSSPETVETRPNEGSTTFSTPPPFFLKREHEGRTIKDGQDSDRPHAHEARGLDRKKPNPERKKAGHATIQEHS